ncbi:low molecular weight protein-tyrosine-phosphatase [Bacillus tuaregi]|uniref:low molecular weight protein-tyrosine-phosphatase n=1 Tax=Bacillus tuaregi TaxID=1816695 RepID=UPI0008F93B90|nr:low molecular weight protein-tyrosine-phosphatase [Bacillus tuaregi]
MVRVLFICLGNICRSPMAEAMFRDLVRKEGLEAVIKMDSAGTGDWHIGHPPHEGTREILKKNQISYKGLKARKVTSDDLSYDYIIGMDVENIKNIKKVGSIPSHVKVKRLLDFVEDKQEKNVPDPYYSGNFEEVYELVKEGTEKLLEEIKNNLKAKGEIE